MVRVPVLSTHSVVAEPSISIAGTRRVSTRFREIRQAPKALLHDHLDGGLRPATVLELADECGYENLPAADEHALAAWFRDAADSGSLVRYLETFEHTVAVTAGGPWVLTAREVAVPARH